MSLDKYLDDKSRKVINSILREYQLKTKVVKRLEFLRNLLDIVISRRKTVFEYSELIVILYNRLSQRNTVFTIIDKIREEADRGVLYIFDDYSKRNYIFNNCRKSIRINVLKLKTEIQHLEKKVSK